MAVCGTMTCYKDDVIVKLETNYDILDPKRTSVAAIGSHLTIGNWDENRPLLAVNTIGNHWEIYISARAGTLIHWQWIIYDMRKRKILLWEDKDNNRQLLVPFSDSHIIVPWNKAQNGSFPLCKGPSCYPYLSALIQKTTSRDSNEHKQASALRPHIESPKMDMTFLGNIPVGNNGFMALVQTLITKYDRLKAIIFQAVQQGVVQEPDTNNLKMA